MLAVYRKVSKNFGVGKSYNFDVNCILDVWQELLLFVIDEEVSCIIKCYLAVLVKIIDLFISLFIFMRTIPQKQQLTL